jgi:signal transduction histidine kinase
MGARTKSTAYGTGVMPLRAGRGTRKRSGHPAETALKATKPDAEIRLLRQQLRELGDRHKRLELERAQYLDLFDFAPVSYALLDRAGIVLGANLATCRLLNVHRSHLIGHPLVAHADARDRRELLDHFRRCRTSVGLVESEVRFRSSAKGLITCRLYSKSAVHGDREVLPTVVIDQAEHRALDDARLVAEQKKALAEREAQLAHEATAARDRFFAAISHELRTPLTPALIAATQLAASESISDETRHLASTIKRNIELEAHLVDDLLDVARIGRGRVDVRFETVDVHQIVREAIGICAPHAHAKRLLIEADLSASSHHVRGDDGRLRQVFWNLLNNAIKFTDGGGSVVVRSHDLAGTVRVSVRDTGVGMDATLPDQLFSPFERGPVRTGSRSGLGLGLAICKGIVAAHGGQIWATSEGPGYGSTFAVDLAAVQPQTQVERDVPSRRHRPSPTGGNEPRRVLIIEDDADSREMLSLFLTHQGYTVEVASSVREALGRLSEDWDVVMSDIGLPDGSGLDVARHAKQLSSGPCRLIALTGYGATADIDASREAGFDDHLVKPIDLDQLLVTMGSATDLRSA